MNFLIRSCFVLLLAAALPLTARAEDNVLPGWLLKLKLSADFRYRHELISAERAGVDSVGHPVALQTPDRNRHRIRLRVGLNFEANPDWEIAARLATSTSSVSGNTVVGDPVSTNQDLTAGSAPKPFWLDRAYVDYHPLTGLSFRAGRAAVPYEGTDLVWDGDLNLEGISISALSKKFGGGWQVLGRAGGFWVWERSSGPDQGLFGAQAGARYSGNRLGGQLAAGYYDYSNLKNGPVIYGSFGNTAANGNYVNDYNLLDVAGQLKLTGEHWESTLIGDFVQNVGAESDTAATGYLAGLAVKFIKLPIDWELGYSYRNVEADAVVGVFNDSDSRGGGTNFNGHKLSLFFTVAKNIRLGGNYFMDRVDPDGADLKYNRLQLDLEAKF